MSINEFKMPRFARIGVGPERHHSPLKLTASTDNDAIDELNKFVIENENETWAVTILDDGQTYMTENKDGNAKSRFNWVYQYPAPIRGCMNEAADRDDHHG